MFGVMDLNNDGEIEIAEYLDYFDIMMYGNKDEKFQQSFKLIDEKR